MAIGAKCEKAVTQEKVQLMCFCLIYFRSNFEGRIRSNIKPSAVCYPQTPGSFPKQEFPLKQKTDMIFIPKIHSKSCYSCLENCKSQDNTLQKDW